MNGLNKLTSEDLSLRIPPGRDEAIRSDCHVASLLAMTTLAAHDNCGFNRAVAATSPGRGWCFAGHERVKKLSFSRHPGENSVRVDSDRGPGVGAIHESPLLDSGFRRNDEDKTQSSFFRHSAATLLLYFKRSI